MKKIKVAVVGVGNMGRHHARIYSQLNNVDLVAVSDLDAKKGQEIAKKYKTKFYRDYRELLDKEKLEAISVVVPTQYHELVACDFLKRKVSVLLEKPISDNLTSARRIIKTARENDSFLAVGYIERFNPAVVKLKEMIKRGKLGEIISLLARREGGFPSQIGDSNVVLDLAVHDIDIMNYLLEEKPVKVFVHKEKFHSRIQEDAGEIFLEYKKASGFVQVNWVTPIKIRELCVTGTKGYVHLNYISQELINYRAKIKKELSDFVELIRFSEPEFTKIAVKKEEPLKLEIKSFLRAISGKKTALVDGEGALESLKTCLAEV